MRRNSTFDGCLLALAFVCAITPVLGTNVQDILATKKCLQVEVSRNKGWVAVTRTYASIPRGSIWSYASSSTSALAIWESDTTGLLGSAFFHWDEPTLTIDKIGWSPDSRFLVIACKTRDGHQPYAFPTLIFDTSDGSLRDTGPLGMIVSREFKFTGDNTLHLTIGPPSSPHSAELDLEKHIFELPLVTKLKEEATSTD